MITWAMTRDNNALSIYINGVLKMKSTTKEITIYIPENLEDCKRIHCSICAFEHDLEACVV